ncbi:hypothetical protein N7536_007742 [Penicillium majusculum]|nr:hypothetical protein N7536_007742 [Penicillium majusculum]
MDPTTLSDRELISLCLQAAPDRIVGGRQGGNLVVKTSNDTVIKFGVGVTEDEANNQRKAYELLDHDIVHVPRFYRFFTDELGRGYILMEYVEGHVIDPLHEPHLIAKIAQVLDYFSTLTANRVGSLGGGLSRGLLWPDGEDLDFDDKGQMESWFNSKLFPGEGNVSFRDCDLVLCHLDIAPRNIIWQPDGRICLVDWASAGFYPRIFEFWAQWNIEGMEGPFNSQLLQSMKPLPPHESVQQSQICRVWYNTQKYYFPSTTVEDLTPQDEKRTAPGPPVPPLPLPDGNYGNVRDVDIVNVHSPKSDSCSSKTMTIVSVVHSLQNFVHQRPFLSLTVFIGSVAIFAPSIWRRLANGAGNFKQSFNGVY